jgi:FtsZ-binding cell division protein ZapB
MDTDTIVTVLTGLAGVTGGFFGGKRLGNQQIQTTAVNTVQLLQAAVAELKDQNTLKDQKIAELGARVEVLEGLVTQRARVEEVHETVTRIAAKVGA